MGLIVSQRHLLRWTTRDLLYNDVLEKFQWFSWGHYPVVRQRFPYSAKTQISLDLKLSTYFPILKLDNLNRCTLSLLYIWSISYNLGTLRFRSRGDVVLIAIYSRESLEQEMLVMVNLWNTIGDNWLVQVQWEKMIGSRYNSWF